MCQKHVGSFQYLLPVLVTTVVVVSTLPSPTQAVEVEDIGLQTGFQDLFSGHHQRGRASVAADFDLDGRVDFYIGNPRDVSFVARNVEGEDGEPSFEVVQELLEGELAWGASAADYDNDGDYDLFVATGANEGIGKDFLFRNNWVEDGVLSFTDVSDQAGISGPTPEGSSSPIPVASANAAWGDVDRDGDVDLFVSVNVHGSSLPDLRGRNILWRNNGDSTFSDVTNVVGLGATTFPTRNSTMFDFDNDGDLDLFESNYQFQNVLWRNLLSETGQVLFEDATDELTPGPSESLAAPFQAFASCSEDFNNDGWQDLLVFMRGHGPEPGSPYPAGHALFINRGDDFVNRAQAAGLNASYVAQNGVMGCQVGDVNGDGLLDVYIGNGGPMAGDFDPNGGQANQLFLTNGMSADRVPRYFNFTHLIDFPAPEHSELPVEGYPPYPYRTHGTNFVDVDGDGRLEIAVVNGGPANLPDLVREPNRLFKFENFPEFSWFKVRAVGNGTTVSMDGIGTRLELRVKREDTGSAWTLMRTVSGGSCFSAHNGFEVYFGLGRADTVESLKIYWPDGFVETMDEGLRSNSSIVVTRVAGSATHPLP